MTLRGSRTGKAPRRHACERRASQRLLCSDLVQLHWEQPDGARCREIAILENLSLSGVGLFTGVPVPEGVDVWIAGKEVELLGRVKQCAFRENGYVVGMELSPESQWAQKPGNDFVPRHLLDVSLLDLE